MEQEFYEGFIAAKTADGKTLAEAEASWENYLATTVSREVIFGVITDLVSDFLYYDRKEDDDLPHGSIEKAIEVGAITLDEIVEQFSTEVRKSAK